MVNPNMVQGGQNNPRMGLQQMTQNRPNMMQNPQQTMNPNIQGIASQLPNQAMVGQQQQQQAVPPPPYPEPPPPYPGSISGQSQVRSVFSTCFPFFYVFRVTFIS